MQNDSYEAYEHRNHSALGYSFQMKFSFLIVQE